MRIEQFKKTWLIIVALMIAGMATAQDVENEFQTRTSVELRLKPIKDVKVYFVPELRIDDSFSLDEYHFEGEVVYEPFKLVSIGARYRFIGDLKDDEDTEYLHRYAFDLTFEKKIKRFEPALRISYTNYAEDEGDSDSEFLRYKGSVKYNIPKSKITPVVGVEAYHQLSNSDLYKMRYIAGINWELSKKTALAIGYKMDYYMNEYKNRHILSVGYKIKL